MREFEDPDFPRRTLTPTLVIAAGADRVADARAAERSSPRGCAPAGWSSSKGPSTS